MPIPQSPYTLALDLGVASLGWALIDEAGQKLVATGVRVFDSGMDETKFERGEQGASNNVVRRTARLHRRQLRRRAARQRDLFLCLQRAGLLPNEQSGRNPESRHQILQKLDQQLWQAWRQKMPSVAAPAQVLPYFLRAQALDHKLQPFELGRALYHLGQRRGFKSNRKEPRVLADDVADTKKSKKVADDDPSKVLDAITQLESEIQRTGARTIGEFFSRLDPTDPAGEKIRHRWTGRKMFESEFQLIWNAQQQFHAALTQELKLKLEHLLLFQRPIGAGKPGVCELERGCPRAPISCLAAQRFRLLQKANDLAIVDEDGKKTPLSPQQRLQVIERLQQQATLSFSAIRTLLGLNKRTHFNLEATDDHLKGNRTAALMIAAFGAERWNSLPALEQNRIVRVWADTEDAADLVDHAQSHWGLDREHAALLCKEPEEGYSRLSLRALNKLIPEMEKGFSYATARRAIYGNEFSGMEPKNFLLPVENVLPQIPNPAVMRSLTELRKVVNAVIRAHGKPARVRIELARDLKRSSKDRIEMQKGMKKNFALNKKQAEKIAAELTNGREASRDEIQRAILFSELDECAYCGFKFEFSKLFQHEVDHILPRSRFQDNSLNNKVLACFNCNKLKLGRTPFEAFSANQEQWEKILVRTRRLKGDKRKRFTLSNDEELGKFSARHLSDTRYATKLAARYMEQLYGGRDVEAPPDSPNEAATRAVFASSGQMTASLRKQWGLEAILKEGPESDNGQNKGKKRTDHRHHAIDAIVIGLSTQAMVHHFARANAAAASSGGSSVQTMSLESPWPGFVDSVRPHIEKLVVSHRPTHRLNGQLHDETNYGRARSYKNKAYVHVRKPVHTLSEKQIASQDVIVDSAVRLAVQEKLKEVKDPKKLESDPPMLPIGKGKFVPIRKVRIRASAGVQLIGDRAKERNVSLSGNHHICLFSTKDKKGRHIWDTPGVISRFEATQRKRRGEAVIQRQPDGEESEFLFSLMGGDIVEMDDVSRKQRSLFVVRTISEDKDGHIEVDFVRHTDARLIAEIKESDKKNKLEDWLRARSTDRLRELNCRKVTVDPLGHVHPCND